MIWDFCHSDAYGSLDQITGLKYLNEITIQTRKAYGNEKVENRNGGILSEMGKKSAEYRLYSLLTQISQLLHSSFNYFFFFPQKKIISSFSSPLMNSTVQCVQCTKICEVTGVKKHKNKG